ncbi:hypothetical protein GDR29_02485 [Xanthomonas oryzae pv. oryzae]|nr:hypothetical protein GDR29_02485 [Xanthomonas oryzae pv. oryzae]
MQVCRANCPAPTLRRRDRKREWGGGKIHERTPRQSAMLAEPDRYAKHLHARRTGLPPQRPHWH